MTQDIQLDKPIEWHWFLFDTLRTKVVDFLLERCQTGNEWYEVKQSFNLSAADVSEMQEMAKYMATEIQEIYVSSDVIPRVQTPPLEADGMFNEPKTRKRKPRTRAVTPGQDELPEL